MKYKQKIKNLGLSAFLLSLALFSGVSQAAIIASYDARIDVDISSTFDDNTIETEFFDSFVDGTANTSGSASGTGDSGPDPLTSNTISNMNAFASGLINDGVGFVDSYWAADGYFSIDNLTNDVITGDVSFNLSWLFNVFTDSLAEEAYASVLIYIEDGDGNIVVDSVYDLDSLIEGAGAFTLADDELITVDNISIDVDGFAEFIIEIDAYGFAESTRQIPSVSEPSHILMASLAMFLLIRQRKLKS
ncbi:MAG: hypothetical protein ACI9O6_000195 [Glaciecola sp.]|jgi:hypothetical protein